MYPIKFSGLVSANCRAVNYIFSLIIKNSDVKCELTSLQLSSKVQENKFNQTSVSWKHKVTIPCWYWFQNVFEVHCSRRTFDCLTVITNLCKTNLRPFPLCCSDQQAKLFFPKMKMSLADVLAEKYVLMCDVWSVHLRYHSMESGSGRRVPWF